MGEYPLTHIFTIDFLFFILITFTQYVYLWDFTNLTWAKLTHENKILLVSIFFFWNFSQDFIL